LVGIETKSTANLSTGIIGDWKHRCQGFTLELLPRNLRRRKAQTEETERASAEVRRTAERLTAQADQLVANGVCAAEDVDYTIIDDRGLVSPVAAPIVLGV
jgi:hypothetical protein